MHVLREATLIKTDFRYVRDGRWGRGVWKKVERDGGEGRTLDCH